MAEQDCTAVIGATATALHCLANVTARRHEAEREKREPADYVPEAARCTFHDLAHHLTVDGVHTLGNGSVLYDLLFDLSMSNVRNGGTIHRVITETPATKKVPKSRCKGSGETQHPVITWDRAAGTECP